MSFRNEQKFKISKKDIFLFKKFLYDNNFKNLYPKRIITSLYFDNKDFDMFLDSEEGTVPRKKIRLRYYNNDLNKIFYETKINSVEGKYKSSTASSYKDLKKFINFGIYDKIYKDCHPKINVSYKRRYFKKDNIRVTLDNEIIYSDFMLNTDDKKFVLDDYFIIEIKFEKIQELYEINRTFALNPIRLSKYCEAVKKVLNY